MSEDKYEDCSPAWLRNLYHEIQDQTACKDDIELAMAYYTYLFNSNCEQPYEMLELINLIFSSYLNPDNKIGTLEAAFGFTRKQAFKQTDKRDRVIAVATVKGYLSGESLTNAKIDAGKIFGIKSTSRLNEIWAKYQQTAVVMYRIELQRSGRDFTDDQKRLAERILHKQRKKHPILLEISEK